MEFAICSRKYICVGCDFQWLIMNSFPSIKFCMAHPAKSYPFFITLQGFEEVKMKLIKA